MRLAVLSDIHGNLVALDAALADLEAHGGADQVWFIGDFSAFGPRPAECVQRVRGLIAAADADEARKGTVRVLRGNTDRYLVTHERMRIARVENDAALAQTAATLRIIDEALQWGLEQLTYDDYSFLYDLPEGIEWYVPGYGPVVGYHGTPGNDEGMLTPEIDDATAADALLDREGRLGIGGHIHRQFDRTLPAVDWRIVNVGSVGVSADRPGLACYGLFSFAGDGVTVDLRAVAYDVNAVVDDLTAVGYPDPEWATRRLRTGR